ncbi:hypothetical protein ACQ4LE_007722 [Meloidogyne hapla]
MAKKNKTNKKKIKGAGNKDNLPHVLKQSNNNTSQPNKQQPPKIASDKLPLDKENIDGQSGQICTSEDKDLEVEVNVTTEASTPSPNFHPSPKLPLDKENIDGQIGQICTSEDKGLKVEVSVSTKDSTPSPNVNSSKSVSPKSPPTKRISIGKYNQLEEESKKYYELKEKIDKMSENEKNFNTKIDKLLNQKGKAELKNFKESLNTDAICTIMVTANLDPAMFIEILTKLYDDNWTLQQKRNPKTGAIIHSPTNMLKRARDFLKDDDHNEAAEMIWGSFSCCISLYFKKLGIDILTHKATNVLCEIAIKCVTPPNIAKALETATLLTNSKSLANECHHDFYKGAPKDRLFFCIDMVQNFIKHFSKINVKSVKSKLCGYECLSKVFVSARESNVRCKDSIVQIYRNTHHSQIFSLECKFDYSAY